MHRKVLKMRILFSCFLAFFISVCLYCQTRDTNKPVYFSIKQLNDSLQKNSNDTLKYKMFLTFLIQKSKAANNNEQLFKAYYKLAGYETNPKKVHNYCDTLLLVAKQLPLSYTGTALQTKAMAYYYEKDYINALQYELKALDKIDQKKDPYTYYKSIYSIGLVYFHIQDYNKAYTYFNKARRYFESGTKYNHAQGYFKSIYREAFSLFYLKNFKESAGLVQKAFAKQHLLKAKDIDYNIPYLQYVQALNLSHKKKYSESNQLLLENISAIKAINDFANEANAYYYIGQNYLNLNNKVQAVLYFKKIDTIFSSKHYSNMEIKEAYTHLITYYKELNNPTQELLYTNKLIAVMNYLQKEYKLLSNSLHYNFDVSSLLAHKQRLESDIKQKQTVTKYITILATVLIMALILGIIYNYRKKKEFHKNYLDLLQQRKIKNTAILADTQKVTTEPATSLLVATNTNSGSTYLINDDEPTNTTKESNDKAYGKLIPLLNDFEKKHGFLNKDLNLNDLAQQWNTNRTYLSECINTHKGKPFIDYIHNLRILYFLDEVEKNKNWRKLKIQAIADQLGFSSARSFSSAFLKETGMSPSFYLQKLRSELG